MTRRAGLSEGPSDLAAYCWLVGFRVLDVISVQLFVAGCWNAGSTGTALLPADLVSLWQAARSPISTSSAASNCPQGYALHQPAISTMAAKFDRHN
jgi:hypothetical protein